jgi:hypothetical protein
VDDAHLIISEARDFLKKEYPFHAIGPSQPGRPHGMPETMWKTLQKAHPSQGTTPIIDSYVRISRSQYVADYLPCRNLVDDTFMFNVVHLSLTCTYLYTIAKDEKKKRRDIDKFLSNFVGNVGACRRLMRKTKRLRGRRLGRSLLHVSY